LFSWTKSLFLIELRKVNNIIYIRTRHTHRMHKNTDKITQTPIEIIQRANSKFTRNFFWKQNITPPLTYVTESQYWLPYPTENVLKLKRKILRDITYCRVGKLTVGTPLLFYLRSSDSNYLIYICLLHNPFLWSFKRLSQMTI